MRLNAHCPTLLTMITLLGSLAGQAQLHPEATAKSEQNTATIPEQEPGPKPGEVRENPKDGVKYVWIPPGTYTMGCSPGDSECDDSEKPPHRVSITKGFWIGQTPVTVGAYKRFASATVQQMPSAPNFNSNWTNDNMPIVDVSWNDSQAYCQWAGGRLPSEAEWEYAARGGSTDARYGPIDDVAWYTSNSGGRTQDVARKRANGFGLYDILGNVSQWVNDWYEAHYYQSSPSSDPPGPSSGQLRVLRGGSWVYPLSGVRVTDRYYFEPARWISIGGFRCVGDTTIRATPAEPAQAAAPAQPAPRVETPGRTPQSPSGGTVKENPKDGLKYVWIPPGTFMMGCSPGDNECASWEKPRHQVAITKGFWIGQTPVTEAAFQRYVSATGPLTRHAPGFTAGWADQKMPADNVYWDEAQAYCQWSGGRLPTEAEWEYAARGGSTVARYGALDEIAWSAENSGREHLDSARMLKEGLANFLSRLKENGNNAHEVGQKRANGFGLYDTLGNVGQWVSDWYDPNYYRHSPSQDPTGPSTGRWRVMRGGYWNVLARGVRVSVRGGFGPGGLNYGGVRCVGEANIP